MSTPLYVPSILIDAVIDVLAAFVQPFVGVATPIIRGQQNRVPPPVTAGQPDPLAFVKLQEIFQSDLETPTMLQDPTVSVQQASISTPTKIAIQVDFYGISAWDWCKAIKAVYRSAYAPAQFPDGMKPLYSDDGHQIPLITGEEQYENHVALTAWLQYNPVVTVPQQSATVLATNIIEDLP
jgi:hypothetical protein